MASTRDHTKPFRFMDLPAELRNRVYALLLCSFDQKRNTHANMLDNLLMESLWQIRIKDTINTAILQTSSQVYREAYDVMVKKNQFVLLSSKGGIPLRSMLATQYTPVIALNEQTKHFKNYVMEVTFSAVRTLQTEQDNIDYGSTSIMILGRDLGLLAASIRASDSVCAFKEYVTIVFNVSPVRDTKPPRYQDDLADFFKSIQKKLFQDLQQLRGLHNMSVHSHDFPRLAEDCEEEMKKDEFEDPERVIEFLVASKELGTSKYHAGEITMAYMLWEEPMRDIDRMQRGSSWANLVKRGGEPFIYRIAELEFILSLNMLHAAIMRWIDLSKSSDPPAVAQPPHQLIALSSLRRAEDCLEPDHWKLGYTWEPPALLRAKLAYRDAKSLRLWSDVSFAQTAIARIDFAVRYFPNDAAVLTERENIMRWSLTG